MKNNKTLILTLQTILYGFILCSCGEMVSCKSPANSKPQTIKITSWNLQTFFDGQFDGNEYTEFKNSKSGWSQQKYIQRLEGLAEAIKTIDADIFVFEELEKEEQLYDISNRLSGNFNFAKLYSYGYFAGDEASSIGCGIISRFPLGEASLHSIDIKFEEEQPSLRPIIKINAYIDGKVLTILINHWKSKSSGKDSGKGWRLRQENLLARLIENSHKENSATIACGDFNMDISEFTYKETDGNCNILLTKQNQEGTVPVYSPWIKENGEYLAPGSYYFQQKWERIDHFFTAGKIKVQDFYPETAGEWADENCIPVRYTIWNGKGFSDHLPVSCIISF